MKGAPFTVRPLVLDIVRSRAGGASSTDVLVELQEQGVETTIDSVCHALNAAVKAGELRREGQRGGYVYRDADTLTVTARVSQRVFDALDAEGNPDDVAEQVLARWAMGRRRAR
jgi:Fe2+ or Zn2+ uptake regulation protein